MAEMTRNEAEKAIAEKLHQWCAEFDTADLAVVHGVIAAAAGQLVKRQGPWVTAESLRDLADTYESAGRRGSN